MDMVNKVYIDQFKEANVYITQTKDEQRHAKTTL